MHAVTPWTTNPPAFDLQIDAPSGNREIALTEEPLGRNDPASDVHNAFNWLFFCLWNWMTRAYRSPNTPTNFDDAVKPGKAKRARIDRGDSIAFIYFEK